MKNRKYWAVGAAFDTDDMTSIFLENSNWYDGYADSGDERNKSVLIQIEIGDVLLMKSSATKGAGHSLTFTKLKAIGIVDEKKDYYSFSVRWLFVNELPLDFDGISYRKTVEMMRNDNMLLYAKQLIEMDDISNTTKILEYKKQIILQGPPGTGKTRLAKLIAKEMTKSKNLGSPLQKIDDFFKAFDASKTEIKAKREELKNLIETFLSKFPKSSIKDLTVESYSIGTGSNDSFCWWIERGLKPLGYYFPGSARSYMIYWSKEKNEYSTHFKHSKKLNDCEDIEKSMQLLAGIISDLIINKDSSEAEKILGNSLILKLFNSYYPEEYFPVNSVPCLNNILKLFNIDYLKLSFIEKNLKVQEIFNQKKNFFKTDVTNLEFMGFLFDNFDLKGEISIQSNAVFVEGEYKLIQFHPAYSYEDFVRGITAETNDKSQVEYKVVNKILAEFAQKALDNQSAKYVLIIDEINRANLPAVLGELIYALEYRYDEDNAEETTVESMYALKQNKDDEEGDKSLKLPNNLYIIGTMNTADRSVGHIDYAIRRRFAFVEVLPEKSIINDVIQDNVVREKANKLYDQVSLLFSNGNLAPDFKATDVQIGHSYFLADTLETLNLKFEHEIIPILKEYLKDGILLNSAKNIIDKLTF